MIHSLNLLLNLLFRIVKLLALLVPATIGVRSLAKLFRDGVNWIKVKVTGGKNSD